MLNGRARHSKLCVCVQNMLALGLGGSGGHAPPGKFEFQASFLVYSRQ